MSGHTPGPWTANFGRISFSGCKQEPFVKDGYLASRTVEGSAYQGGSYDIKAADGSVVLSHVWDTLGLERTQANVRLIAAAPDMAKALAALLDRCNRELADPEGVHEVYFARQVLAKAIGGAA